jgi:hypothetical protein
LIDGMGGVRATNVPAEIRSHFAIFLGMGRPPGAQMFRLALKTLSRAEQLRPARGK